MRHLLRIAKNHPLLLLLISLLVGTGCVSSSQMNPLAQMMVSAPNRLNPLAGPNNPLPPVELLAGASRSFMVNVGPPDATLSVSIVEPPDTTKEPKGTVIVLHGIVARGVWMMKTAKQLAKADYRVVLVDLRGHGRSTGKYLTYGLQEARDLSQVINVLSEHNMIAGKLGVYGVSYGATTSIHLAGIDPRIDAVVAVAPFSTMREEVPQFSRVIAPGVGLAIPEETYQEAIDDVGKIAQFNPDESSAIQAIQQATAPTLILHGKNDWLVPHIHGERLQAAAPDHCRLVSVPYHGHTSIWLDPTNNIAQMAVHWFDEYLFGQQNSPLLVGQGSP
ncbi:MAG: alpha/beta fold hydrolase [Planctomycetia bacterium]|jgi:pimeloyl-ACP methyl ester carboxylesterase